MAREIEVDGFQHTVSELLIRHRSILDIMTKSQEATSRMNRAVAKAVTSCGCLKINAGKKSSTGATLSDLRQFLDSNLSGEICNDCRETVESEIGRNLFYLAALCNVLDLNLMDIVLKEEKRLKMLGIFNLS
ncbi:MAG: DUF1573 domain-containing protein [Peptococcaceae bacterium]|nr:DUF1573 domain-containing protein [Peptococcaceae bacterium]